MLLSACPVAFFPACAWLIRSAFAFAFWISNPLQVLRLSSADLMQATNVLALADSIELFFSYCILERRGTKKNPFKNPANRTSAASRTLLVGDLRLHGYNPRMNTTEFSSDQTTTLAHVRQRMQQWVAARQWEQYHLPKNLAASVCIEAGELLEMFQWLTPDEVKQKSGDEKFRVAVSEEMCDVLMYLVSLANAMDIDLARAIEHKMKKNELKYPAEKFQGHYERPIG